MLSPIILFVYNRPSHTRETLDALAQNILAADSDLFIFSDGAKENTTEKDKQQIGSVRKVLYAEKRFKQVTVIESPTNKGLARSIIEGVSKIVGSHGKAIVLEDDLITSRHFLKFMNEALDKFENEETVACISGYFYPVKEKVPPLFFIKGADCWGWATWKRGWDIFESNGKFLLDTILKEDLEDDFNFFGSYPYSNMLKDQIGGRNSSWAIRWYASAFIKNKLTLYPGKSYVNNIGFDGTGTHSGRTHFEKTVLSEDAHLYFGIKISEDITTKRIIANYFTEQLKKGYLKSAANKIKMVLKRFIQ